MDFSSKLHTLYIVYLLLVQTCIPISHTDIVAVESCQEQNALQDFPDSPRTLALNASSFNTPANPNTAHVAGGVKGEGLVAGELEEYQSYQFSVQLANEAGEGPVEDTHSGCVRTLEAGDWSLMCVCYVYLMYA